MPHGTQQAHGHNTKCRSYSPAPDRKARGLSGDGGEGHKRRHSLDGSHPSRCDTTDITLTSSTSSTSSNSSMTEAEEDDDRTELSARTSQKTSEHGWDIRFQELVHYRHTHGDTCVPKGEGSLGRWVARQRELKRTHKLRKDREQRLNDTGFIWNTIAALWESRYKRLVAWRARHGHCAVPTTAAGGGDLGVWVSKQRQLRKRGRLSEEKVRRLDEVGFTWCRMEVEWEEKLRRLVEWGGREGHVRVPFGQGELGWWVNTQRQARRKGRLAGERLARLEAIGFVWRASGGGGGGGKEREREREREKEEDGEDDDKEGGGEDEEREFQREADYWMNGGRDMECGMYDGDGDGKANVNLFDEDDMLNIERQGKDGDRWMERWADTLPQSDDMDWATSSMVRLDDIV